MRNLIPIFALAAAIPACTFDAGGNPDARDPLRANLEQRAFLDLGASSRIGVTATGPDGRLMPEVAPAVTGGRAVLRATPDGFVIVEDLDVALADVTVPPGPQGGQPLHLTDLHLRLGTQIDADGDWHADGMGVTGTGTGDLLLDWSWRLDDGTIYPLATQKLTHAPFSLSVREDDAGRLDAAVWMEQDGSFKTIADEVTLSDLSVAVVASRAGAATR